MTLYSQKFSLSYCSVLKTVYKTLSYKLDELFSSPFRMNEGGSGSLINISSIISFMAAFHHIDV